MEVTLDVDDWLGLSVSDADCVRLLLCVSLGVSVRLGDCDWDDEMLWLADRVPLSVGVPVTLPVLVELCDNVTLGVSVILADWVTLLDCDSLGVADELGVCVELADCVMLGVAVELLVTVELGDCVSLVVSV